MDYEFRSRSLCMRVTPSTLDAFRSLKWGYARLSDADLLEGLMRFFVSSGSHAALKQALFRTSLGNRPYDGVLSIDLCKCHPMLGAFSADCITSQERNTNENRDD